MELKWLEDLQVLLEEKSLTRAAQRQHVTQPAFSRRIRLLEEWLGTELLDRSTKPVSIRRAGKSVEPVLQDLISQIYDLRNRAQLVSDRVTIVSQHTLAVSRFPQLIRRVNQRQPNSSYRIVPANYEECEALFRREADLMLCYQSESCQLDVWSEQIRRVSLGHDRLLPVASRQFLEQLGHIEPGMTLPMLMYQAPGFLANSLTATCLPAVMRDYRMDVICESAFAASLKELVLAHMGIAWLTTAMVGPELQDESLVSLESVLGGCALEEVLFYREHGAAAEIGQIMSE